MSPQSLIFFFFFFNDTATTEIYTLSLHDALPISQASHRRNVLFWLQLLLASLDEEVYRAIPGAPALDRKSTRLNSSHLVISYAVFCLKKKKKPTLYLLESVRVQL